MICQGQEGVYRHTVICVRDPSYGVDFKKERVWVCACKIQVGQQICSFARTDHKERGQACGQGKTNDSLAERCEVMAGVRLIWSVDGRFARLFRWVEAGLTYQAQIGWAPPTTRRREAAPGRKNPPSARLPCHKASNGRFGRSLPFFRWDFLFVKAPTVACRRVSNLPPVLLESS